MRKTRTRGCLLGVLGALALLMTPLGCENALAGDSEAAETATVRGQVRGPEGWLSGARVVVAPVKVQKDLPEEIDPVVEALSDEDGRFAIEVSGEAPFAVYATAAGLASALVSDHDPADELLLELAPGIGVEGVVTDIATGDPLEGVTIRAWYEDTRAFRRHDAGDLVASETRSGADGRYSLPDLRQGVCFLEAHASGRESFQAELTLSFQDTLPKVVHFPLAEGSSLRGRVLDPGGNPLVGARVRVSVDRSLRDIGDFSRWRRFDRASPTSTQSLEDGSFSLEGLPTLKSYSLSVKHAEYGKRFLSGIEAGGEGVDIRLPEGATIRFSLVDGAGEPYEGFLGAELEQSTEDGGRIRDSFYKDELHADNGIYSLFPVSPGRPTLTLEPDSHVPLEIDLEAEAGAIVDLGELALPSGVTLLGRVLDDQGEVVSGAMIVITYNKRDRLIVRAGDDGRFTASGFDEGSVKAIDGSAPGYASAELSISELSDSIELVLARRGKVTGRVMRADLEEAANSFVVRTNRQQAPEESANSGFASMMMGEGKSKKSFSGVEDGVFELNSLSPGRYSILIEAPGCIPFRVESVQIVSGETSELGEISLVPGATIEGFVVNSETGVPVAGASVRRKQAGMNFSPAAILGDEDDPADAVSGALGEFSIGGLPSGALVFEVEHESFAKAEFEVEISPGVPPAPVHVELGAGGAIEGITRDPGGAVLPGAMVVTMNGMIPDLKRTVNSDDEGHFRLDKLAPGNYMLIWMRAPGSGGGEATGAMVLPQMRSVVVEEGKTTRLDDAEARKTSLTLRGRFLRGGEPLASIQSAWAPVGGAALPISARSDESGAFELVVPAPGEYQVGLLALDRDQPELGWRSTTVIVKVTRENASQLEIVLPESRVRGVVTHAETGAAIARAQIHAIRQHDEGELVGLDTATSDSEGNFAIDSLRAGEHYFFVSASECTARILGPFDLGEDEEIDDLSVSLDPARVREVRVRNESGEPLTGMNVIPFGEGDLGWAWAQLSRFSDADGTVFLSGLPDGFWNLAVMGPGAALTILEGVEIGPDASEPLVAVVKRAGVLTVLVTGPGETRIAGAKLKISEKGGRDLTRLLRGTISPRKSLGLSSDQAGQIVIDSLPAGEYRLSVTGPDGRSARASARVAAGEETTVEVSLP